MSDDTNNMVKVLTALISPYQDIENTLQTLLLRTIDDAEGDALTVIGRIVGEFRFTDDDELYRRAVRARVATNRSSGKIEDMIKVIGLVLNDLNFTIRVRNDGNATMTVQLDNDTMPSSEVFDLLMRFVRDAQGGGIRTIVEAPLSAPSTCFKWDTPGRGWDSGAPFRDARD